MKIIEVECTNCGTIHKIQVEPSEWKDYTDGIKHVKECFPNMSNPIREMFISGICPECWEKLFPKYPETE